MIFNKNWWKAAAIRSLKTVAQSALALIPAAVTLSEVNWVTVLSTAAVAGILSLLTSLAGLPEVDEEDDCHVTIRAYDDYDEDGSPIVNKEAEDG